MAGNPGEVSSLLDLSLADLRDIWTRVLGQPPPCTLSRELLLLEITWTTQAQHQGGLSSRTQRRIKALEKKLRTNPSTAMQPTPVRYQPGTVLTKDWQGRRYLVMVQERGFAYDGHTYQSLSEIARRITGTRWNGPAFFGLRPPSPSTHTKREQPLP